MKKISLITMAQGNPKALKATLESFKDIVSEVIFGDLLVFQDDREIIKGYQDEYNLKFVPLPFNYIYKNGFGATLNELAHHTSNDIVLYMNCAEVVDGPERISRILNELAYGYNMWAFDHATDAHTWFRMYDKTQLEWSGIIHEELRGEKKPWGYYIFRMKDTAKDMDDLFKAKVCNDIKEIVYFTQYIKLVEHPELLGETSAGWLEWAKGCYESLKKRLIAKGSRVWAFENGNLVDYIKAVMETNGLSDEDFKSSSYIHFQGEKSHLE